MSDDSGGLYRRVVSVVIPSREGRATLERALDSLLPNADYIDETLLVFSNSGADYRDWCRQLLPRYASSIGLRLLSASEPGGSAVARNVGIAAARGRYLAFLDDDDEWMPNKLSVYLQAVQQQALASDFVLFSTVISCLDDRSDWLLFPSIAYDGRPIADFVLSAYGGAQTSALLLPTSLAQRVMFDGRLSRHTDYDFCMRLEEAGARFHSIAQPLSYWYRRGSPVEKGGTLEFCQQWLQANRHRLSRAAYVSYVESELFAAARLSGRRAEYLRFWRSQLTWRERCASSMRLLMRALRKTTHPGSAGHRGRYQPA